MDCWDVGSVTSLPVLPGSLLGNLWNWAVVAAAAGRARLVNALQHNHSVCVFFFFPPVSVLMFVGVCACPGWCLCVVRGGSSQTDNHRGGRTESERDECSVYWNKCKDRLQCQTGRACAPTCVCVLIVLSSDWLLSHTHVCEKVCFKHQFPLVTSEENWLFFKLSLPPVMICIGQPFITKSQRGVPEFANQQPAQHWSPQQ